MTCPRLGIVFLTASGLLRADAVSSSPSRITEFRFSAARSGPSVVQADTEGFIWVALAQAGKIARMTKTGEVREFGLPVGAFPVGIARDRGRNLYVSDIRRNVIVQLDVVSGATRDYAIPTTNAWPFFVGLASDGRVWFTERVGNRLGVLDPIRADVTEYVIPTEQAQPAGLTVTLDDHVYFTENTGHKVGHFDPKTKTIVEITLPSVLRNSPYYGLAGIASDSRGDIWFSELDGRIGHIDRKQGRIEEIPLRDATLRPAGIVVDRWDIVWFTELDGNAIGSYNPSLKTFDHYPIPTGAPDHSPMGPPEASARGEMPTIGFRARTSRPFGIAVDSDGRIWFSEQYAHQVGRLDVPAMRLFAPTGRITNASAPVLLQVRSSVSTPKIRFELNGKLVVGTDVLDLRSAPAGNNELRARFTGDGIEGEAFTNFTFDPDLAAIEKSVRKTLDDNSLPKSVGSQTVQLLRDAQDAANAGDGDRDRNIEHTLIRLVAENSDTNPAAALILRQLLWRDRFGQRRVSIPLADDGERVAAKTSSVEIGETVEWRMTHAEGGLARVSVVPCGDSAEGLPRSQTDAGLSFYKPGNFSYSYGAFSAKGATECRDALPVAPRSIYLEEFPVPDADSVPGVLAADNDGSIWFTEGGGGYSRLAAVPLNNKIGRLRKDGTIQQYSTPTRESAPTSIHIGAEGHVWFTERSGNKIGELVPDTGTIVEHPLPMPNSGTTGIAVDKEGRIWFASKASSKIGYLDPSTGRIVEMETPTPGSEPSTITVDGDDNIWFDERAHDRIVIYQRQTGKMGEYVVPTKGSRVVGLVPDNRGSVFFLELGANKVGRLDIASGQVTEYSIPTAFSSPFKATLDGEGRLWFTEVFGNKVGSLLDGVFHEYLIPTSESMPGGITTDKWGNIWFSEQAGNKIAKIPALPRPISSVLDAAATPERRSNP